MFVLVNGDSCSREVGAWPSGLAVGYQVEYILMLTYATVLLVVGLEQLVAVWKTGEKRRRKRWQMWLNFAAACLVFLGSIDPLGFFSGENVWGLLADSRFFFWVAGYTVTCLGTIPCIPSFWETMSFCDIECLVGTS